MPHHFRTIEEFVQLIEGWKLNAEGSRSAYKEHQQGYSYWNGRALACQDVLHILRNSNIGIVHPSPEQEAGEHVHNWIPVNLHPFCVCSTCKMMRPKTGAELLLSGPWHESNGTRCPDCGLPCDPATGEHKCSDGQVRGFRVSPE